ncbi:MAG: hypothetical protein WD604_01075 [Balneolaceae bacterium]
MKKVRKCLKILRLVLLILFASLGIGITGGIPILPVYKKEDDAEFKIELVKPENDEPEPEQVKISIKKSPL